jgi:hypothetical protein
VLKTVLRPQLEALKAGMTHREYILACRNDITLVPEDYENESYPHPYLEIWMLLARYRDPNGPPLLPEPMKSPLDQDADLMLAFDVLEEIVAELAHEEELREIARQKAREYFRP